MREYNFADIEERAEVEAKMKNIVDRVNKQEEKLSKFTQFYEEIEDIRKTALTFKDRNKRFAYPLSNVHEVVAYGLTDKDFQEYLESIPYITERDQKGFQEGKETLWSAFVEAVRKMLGLSVKNNTALSAVLRATEGVLDVTSQELETGFQQIREGKPLYETGPLYSRVTPAGS